MQLFRWLTCTTIVCSVMLQTGCFSSHLYQKYPKHWSQLERSSMLISSLEGTYSCEEEAEGRDKASLCRNLGGILFNKENFICEKLIIKSLNFTSVRISAVGGGAILGEFELALKENCSIEENRLHLQPRTISKQMKLLWGSGTLNIYLHLDEQKNLVLMEESSGIGGIFLLPFWADAILWSKYRRLAN